MRPSTLTAVADRFRRGETIEKAMAEFLDAFYASPNHAHACRMLADEPAPTGDVRIDALLAACADYLAIQYTRERAPKWTSHPTRILAHPYFTTSSQAPAMREWLTHSSPAEFKRHNIFTEAHPLRRKMSEHVAWAPFRRNSASQLAPPTI